MASPLPTIALDFSASDDRLDRASFSSSVTLLDYEVAIWQPSRLLSHYYTEGPYSSTYQGLPSLGEDQSFALERDLVRRREEMRNFLALGKTLVVLTPAPQAWYIDTGQREHSGTGRNRKTTQIVAPRDITSAAPFPLELVGATGEKMRLVAGDPFASFWREAKGLFYYDAYMSEHPGTGAVVIEGTDFHVAAIAEVGKGTVILLPQPSFEPPDELWAEYEEAPEGSKEETAAERKVDTARRSAEQLFVSALFELVEAVRTTTGDYHLPEWSGRYRVPSEAKAKDDLDKGEERLAKLTAQIDKKRAALAKINEKKLLFAGTGKAFEALAEQAFEALGCNVEPGKPGRTDRVLRNGGRVAVAEMKGKGKSAAEADAAQLEKWVTEYKLEHEDEDPKGILIVNVWKGKPLDARTAAGFPAQMRPYSENRGHCLITGIQLLGAWLDAEANAKKKNEILASIFDCVGVYPHYTDWSEFLTSSDEDAPAAAEGED